MSSAVSSSRTAERYYCGPLGFRKQWEYRPQAPEPEPGYLGLERDGVRLHLTSFGADGVAGTVVVFQVRDVDELFAEFSATGAVIDLSPTDQAWGLREMYVRDADGNSLRFGQPLR